MEAVKLVSHAGTEHLAAGMAAAVLGMIGNWAVSRYKRSVARRIRSITLEAEAQHSWLDTLSSFGALVGLAGVAVGWPSADPIAGWTTLETASAIGTAVEQAVHEAVPQARRVDWIPRPGKDPARRT